MLKLNTIVNILILSFLCVTSQPSKSAEESSTNSETESIETPRPDESVNKAKEPSKTDDEVIKREEEAINIDGLNVAQQKEMQEKAEKYAFQTEVDRMMKLIINSLYKNKDIFLRELISNASDALDKIRYIGLTTSDSNIDIDELIVKVKGDRLSKTLHIIDNGIGMTKEELVSNLGTIARSGTTEFLNRAAKEGSSSNSKELTDLIGQFGVGFYSSFLVANRVTVVTKSDSSHTQYIWQSGSDGSFTVTPDPRGNTMKRGTEVILHLKEETAEYLEKNKLQELIMKYSQFINFPIYLWSNDVKKSSDVTTNTDSVSTSGSTSNEDDTVSDEKEIKTESKSVWDWKLINRSKPIWTRPTSEITEDEYNEFYKSFTKDQRLPLTKIHFLAEGEVTFKSILYIPKSIQQNDSTDQNSTGDDERKKEQDDSVKLFVKRVFITDKGTHFLPNYLRFIKGIVDSDDLPLNVSRETLQQHKLIKLIKKKLIRKALDMIKKIPEKDYADFWKEYGYQLKAGVMDDTLNKNRIAKLLRFYSSHSKDRMTSFEDYVNRMKPKQEHIYFISGVSNSELEKSPMVETLLAHNYEVIFLNESVDEYAINSIGEFNGKKFQSAAKEGLKIAETEKLHNEFEQIKKDYEPLQKWLTSKESGLKDQIGSVVLSERLRNSPAVIVAHRHGMSGNMERIVRGQSYNKYSTDYGNDDYMQKDMKDRILEINPKHPLIRQIKYKLEHEVNRNETIQLAEFIYNGAMLKSSYPLRNVRKYTDYVDAILKKTLDIPLDQKIENMDDDDDEVLEDTSKNPDEADKK